MSLFPAAVEARLMRHVARHHLLPRGSVVICAVSGGADSMALLAWLLGRAAEFGIEVQAAHLDHAIPEARSDEAATVVADFCARHGLVLHARRVDVPARARRWATGVEDAGRRIRQSWFRALARHHGARVATAHTADDQAETVLMRVLRGTGTRGLRAVLPRVGTGPWLVRPLLTVRRAETRAAAAALALPVVEDPTNDDPAYNQRNRIRVELLPLLADRYNPRIVESLCRLADAAREDAAALEAAGELAWREHADAGPPLSLAPTVVTLPRAVRADLYRRAVEACGGADLDAAGVARLDDLLEGDVERSSRAGGVAVQRTRRGLTFGVPGSALAIGEGAALQVPGETRVAGWVVRARLVDAPGDPSPRRSPMDGGYLARMAAPWRAVLPADIGPLHVRGRRPGDRWRPPRGSGSCKLKATLNAWHVPVAERDGIPLVTAGDDIACLPGWGVDDRWSAPASAGRVIELEIAFEEEEPPHRRAQ